MPTTETKNIYRTRAKKFETGTLGAKSLCCVYGRRWCADVYIKVIWDRQLNGRICINWPSLIKSEAGEWHAHNICRAREQERLMVARSSIGIWCKTPYARIVERELQLRGNSHPGDKRLSIGNAVHGMIVTKRRTASGWYRVSIYSATYNREQTIY